MIAHSFISALLLSTVLFAAAPSDSDSQVGALVRQLNDDRFSAREEAERALLEIGPRALAALPKTAEGLPAETIERVKRIRRKLQQQSANDSIRASQITFSGESIPLSKVIDAIGSQSKNALIDDRASRGQPTPDPAVTVRFDKTPFWEAFDATLAKANMRFYPYGRPGALSLLARGDESPPPEKSAFRYEAFRFATTGVSSKRNLQTEDDGLTQLRLEIAWEPRIKPIVIYQESNAVTAADDQGRPLRAITENAAVEVPDFGDSSATEINLGFRSPPRDAKEIAKLEGKIAALLPSETAEFRFTNLKDFKRTERRIADASVTLTDVHREGDAWAFRLVVQFQRPDDAFASHRGWTYKNEVLLETVDGKTIPFDRCERFMQSESAMGVVYFIVTDKPLDGATFVYKSPTAILRIEIPFRFERIQLP